MKNKKGFTLIELLAVIVILGLLLLIAIPSITKYINQSKKETVVSSINSYITALMTDVNDMSYSFVENDVIYAVPIECISLEKGGGNPFGEWMQANDAYFAYVLVQYDKVDYSYKYGFTFKDSGGYALNPIIVDDLGKGEELIKTGLNTVKPNKVEKDIWEKSGFEISDDIKIKVLKSATYGEKGDGKKTCTLAQKAKNSEKIEKSKNKYLKNDGDVSNKIFGKSIDRSTIGAIYTLDYIPEDIEGWDASSDGSGLIKAWIVEKGELDDLYIAQDGGVNAPKDSKNLFYNYFNVKKFDASNLNTSNVIYMTSMFRKLSSLEEFDVSNFDTSNVEDMQSVFHSMKSLKSINLSGWDTSEVNTMSYIFYNCQSLNSLDLSSFDTSSLVYMRGMFQSMISLYSIDLSNFNTSKVKYMSDLFYSCTGLKEINISSFNTNLVLDMEGMFAANSSVEKIKFNRANFSSVEKSDRIFSSINSNVKIIVKDSDAKEWIESRLGANKGTVIIQ